MLEAALPCSVLAVSGFPSPLSPATTPSGRAAGVLGARGVVRRIGTSAVADDEGANAGNDCNREPPTTANATSATAPTTASATCRTLQAMTAGLQREARATNCRGSLCHAGARRCAVASEMTSHYELRRHSTGAQITGTGVVEAAVSAALEHRPLVASRRNHYEHTAHQSTRQRASNGPPCNSAQWQTLSRRE